MSKKHQNISGRAYAFHHWGGGGVGPKYLLISIKYSVINLTQSWDLLQVVTVSPEDKVGEYLLQAPILYESTV